MPRSGIRPEARLLDASSIWQLVRLRAELTPDWVLATDEHGGTLTFAELRTQAELVAAGLLAGGLRPGDIASWQLPSRIDTIVLIGAMARLGVVQNPLIPMLRRGEVEFIVGQTGARLLIVPGVFRNFDHLEMAREIAKELPDLAVLNADDPLPQGDPAGLPAEPDPRPGDSAQLTRWLFYTSGTTAAPKGARHSDTGLLGAARTFCRNLDVRSDDRVASLTPMAHVGGVLHVLSALLTGSRIVISAVFDPATTPEQMEAAKVTLGGSGVPFIQGYLKRQAERPDQPFFPKARGFLVGGAPRPPAMHAEVRDKLGGVGMVSGYGMTECPYLSWGRIDDPDDKLIAAEGRPGPETDLVITDDEGNPVADGESGELRVKAPQLMLGYVDSSLDADAFDEQGYFKTGDLARIDAEGYVYITGRIKDVIIRNMENISAREVEIAALGFPGAAEFAAIGLPDAVTGERVCAVVVPADPSKPPLLDHVTTYLRAEGLNPRKLPVQLEIVSELPRNAMGKVLKAQLKARFEAAALEAAAKVAARSQRRTVSLDQLTTITYELNDNVATVTLNRPDKMNSFNLTMVKEFEEVWREARENDEIHSIVLRAAPGRAFCAGIDISEGAWWVDDTVFQQEDPSGSLGPKAQHVWKPVIAAVHGIAAGGAFYFLNESDIIICSEDATFFDPHASGGMISAFEPVGMLHRGVPLGDVMRWALLGNDERITAETALRLGIVTEVVPRESLWEHADQLATEIAGRRPLGIQGTVRAIWESMDMTPSTARRMGLSYPQRGNKGGGPSHPKHPPKPRFR